MIELTLRVRPAAVEDVLDRLLPLVPGGVHVQEASDPEPARIVIFETAGPAPAREIETALGDLLDGIETDEVPDDWQARRLRLYEPLVIGPFCVRPAWAPPAPEGSLEIIVGEGTAFGTGAHPTTQGCLQAIAAVEPAGAFVDLGCGSGVLAIAAAKLGWAPVIAVDVSPDAVEAARGNATASGVEIDARALDLTSEPAPAGDTVAANVPVAIHEALAPSLAASPPRNMIVSGIGPTDVERVSAAYGPLGLAPADVAGTQEWSIVVFVGTGKP